MDVAHETSPAPADPKKVFGNPQRHWTIANDVDNTANVSKGTRRSSTESTSDILRPQTSGGSEDKAHANGISKLFPKGRRWRKKSDNELSSQLSAATDSRRGSGVASQDGNSGSGASGTSLNGSRSPPENEQTGNLLTDDSEPDGTPSISVQDSHSGFYTSSSPLITTTAADDNDDSKADNADTASSGSAPAVPASDSNQDLPLRSFTTNDSTLEIPGDGSSKKRNVSPGRRLKDAFNPSQEKKSPSVSPDRTSGKSSGGKSGRNIFSRSRTNSLSAKRAAKAVTESPPPPVPKPIPTDEVEDSYKNGTSPERGPKTPPESSIPAPQTTVTPPTPTDLRPLKVTTADLTTSPESVKGLNNLPPGTVVSPSGNMISHRRVRSASSVHQPSKLSNSISASLSPTLEESKTAGSRTPSANQQGGFFSSVFSVAQNAASTISNTLNTQTRARSSTQPTSPDNENPSAGEISGISSQATNEREEEKRQMAVDTLGNGDLNISQFDIEATSGGVVTTKDGVVITKPDTAADYRKSTASQRDEVASRLEDMRAARAISMAYGKPSEGSTTPPVAAGDGLEVRPSASIIGQGSGEQTTPTGSVVDGEPGNSVKRSGSVRSRLAQRRHRGSSGATISTIGAVGASALALGIPGANSSAPRLTGFAVASKKRNRDFHQTFRSVPEDDYLIEDYSCALQRDIILAGRIYISEGHICFSSNILGWVTTLVISFDEVVAIEKENTAMVFPNAIAIQTLHARHIFRSLLSRETTYDVMVNIWKINHPALKSSINGTRITQGTGDKTEKADESEAESDLSDEEEIYDEDEDGDGMESFVEAGEGSVAASEHEEPAKPLSRKASGIQQSSNGATPSPGINFTSDTKGGGKAPAAGESGADFPGPATHAPTEFTDPSGRYERLIKDEVIPAPLGKVYTLVFGPASGAFMNKFLLEDQKATELQFEDDKKGLSNDTKSRQYSYIKPLNGSIGPKQTKCISTETLDYLDLEKAVLVTLATQTPDVPSGNVFCVKTKYLFTWAPGNQTRFLMTCTIEWSGKSWLKGPIEKGATDGQIAFGNDLIRVLKASVAPQGRANGVAKSGSKAGKGRRRKGDTSTSEAATAAAVSAALEAKQREAETWGIFEPLRGPLGPILSPFKVLWNSNVALGIIGILLFIVFVRGPARAPTLVPGVAYPGLTVPQRLAAYEEMWVREESELWNWLEERVGLDGLSFPVVDTRSGSQARQGEQRKRLKGANDLKTRINEEKMSQREMDDAIRVTRERLNILEEVVKKRKTQKQKDEEIHTEL
ncbi:hypothetical protein DTO207G8_1716 [Paecilomyces variotii]|nr:hypothetical protein DTO169E5_2490 [Paecilomyces variotii]KAJ9257939.1 hypothetical protein DTO207G8_1716 [Paecilomyces variotii]